MLNKDEIDFIKNLSKEMKEQDNCSTAGPYGFLLTQEEISLIPDGYGEDDYHYTHREDYELTFSDTRELWEWLNSSDCLDEIGKKYHNVVKIALEVGEKFLVCYTDSLGFDSVGYKKRQTSNKDRTNFFLTKKGYLEHLGQNKHNLTKPESYCIHLFRNPEMRKVIELIHKLAEEL